MPPPPPYFRPADEPAESNVETRTVLAFAVRSEALVPWLPAGWHSSPALGGPADGANLNVIFADRLFVKTADGVTANQLAVLAIPVRRANSAGVLIAYGLSAQAAGAPGYYQVFEPATVSIERTLRTAVGETRVAEHWDFASADGEQLELELEYARRVPERGTSINTVAYSGHDPTRHRLYVADQGSTVLRSVPAGTDDVISQLRFRAAGPRLAALFDGSEQLVSVTALPWTVRQAFLPAV